MDTLKSIKKNLKTGKNKLKNKNKNNALQNFKKIKPKINKKLVYQQELFKKTTNANNREKAKKELNNTAELKRDVNDLISETTPDQPYKLYRVLNKFLNPIIYLRWKSIIFLIVCSVIFFSAFTLIFISKKNSGVYIVVCVYIILYLFFINTMNIKMSCGKNTSLLELLNPIQSWIIFKSTVWNNNNDDYINSVRDYSCFEYNTETGSKKKFSRSNVNKIKNLNTNFNKYLNISENLNSLYPYRLPNKKYVFLTIYLLSVIFLFVKSVMDEFIVSEDSGGKNDKGKTEQVINSIIVCLIFFVWTCVLDLPMWILIVLIVILILIYLLIGAADLYSSFSTGKVDDEMLCKPHIIPFVNTSWAGVSFQDNLTNCMNDKSNGMFLTMMKPYLETINGLEKQLDDQNSKLNNLGNVADMFKDKVQKMIEQIYLKIKGIINKIVKIKNKIYDIMKNIILMFKSMIWTMVNLVYSIESIHNIICDLPLVDCCFDEKTVIKTVDKTNTTEDKSIKDIEVGDVLIDNTIVLGVIKSKYINQDIYLYKNIIVTGDHFVYDNGEHKTINKCEDSILINNYKAEYIYCLITSTQKIQINDIIFSDYFDMDNLRIQNEIQNKIICKLNNFDTLPLFNYKNTLPLWSFEKSTMITMNDKTQKQIKNISIGEDTYYGKVRALAKIQINKSNIYKINNVITTGDQILKINGIWFKVSDLIESNKIEINDNIFYHIIVDTNKLLINNMTFTDFEQYPNYGYLEFNDKSLP